MLMDFVCCNNGQKLCDSSQKQIGMSCLFIHGLTVGNTKTVLKVVDGFFNIHPDFIGLFPFTGATLHTRISAEIFLRVNINHPSGGRRGARVVAVAYTVVGFVRGMIFLFHLRTRRISCWEDGS